MTRTRRARFLALVGAAALVPAALVGCSAGGQSVADACQVAGDTVTEAMGDLSSVATDPEAATDMFADTLAAMKEAGDKIENEEVKAAFDDFNGSFEEFQTVMADATEDPTNIDTDAMTEISSDLQASSTKLQELCG
ncbi:hypothetical protein GCM10010915_07110 [Microbacterium faecale]|uniref:Uncharacterized protein n=1 Tax=Microbacterium faecale TaxID=1804630 RepID=A0A916Y3T7_9MICO|nr:hypothetical protein [Microbacterium faecale]GGD29510.1 hypothetical protein GCM10010915_07110 [Microbacterium faecale]